MRLRRKLLIGFGVAAAAVIVVAGAVAAVAWWEARSVVAELHAGAKGKVVAEVLPELKRMPIRTLVPAPPEAGAQTILLIGSDRRSGTERQVGARSDTTIVLRVDPKRHRLALLSIPRDLYVAIPGHGHDRINMAYELGGEKLLTRTVRETLGIRIDHFVEVDFRGFRKIVHDLGGLWLPVDQRYFNRNVGTAETNYSSIDLLPGYQKLNGAQALAYARYRHDDSDLYRAARQQLVIRDAVHQSLAHPLDFLRMLRLARDFAAATTSDIDSVRQLWGLANVVRSARVDRLTIDVADTTLYGADYLIADESQLKAAVRRLYGIHGRAGATARTVAAASRAGAAAAPRTQLYADGGRAQALLRPLAAGMRLCVPTALPPGYGWPYEHAARWYPLDGHPAIALYASAGSGRSVLWMFTTWRDPPVLAHPTGTVKAGGRTLELYTDSGRLRQIAWQVGPTRVWLTNTLRNDLTNAEMLALAKSCRGR
jgi:LCP family protein required for cell wall assembly